MEKDFEVPLSEVNIIENTWFKGLYKDTPTYLVYFPYAQHYLSDSPGHYSHTGSEEEMIQQYKSLDLAAIPEYSVESYRQMFKVGFIVNKLFILLLIISLIF
ncbi:hypothetical protein [Atopobacter phocae]|uniref:hypothetical protein n=1 Tax=Atopobacter phocae TaxID=136492 RepID=UPI001FE1E4D0|nr:hypothetical protein [Atopobacter phocae]